MTESLPRLLQNLRPAPAVFRSADADFVVEEVPLYPADGQGTHTYFLLEKTGLSTSQAVHAIAKALNVRRHEIGFAGQKDAHATARQWMSVEHVDPALIAQLGLARLRVLEVTQHTNKLRIGHLKGNRFTIKVRQTEPDRLAEFQDALHQLTERGVPNYFGQQRFGYRGDTWAVGRAIVRRDIDEAVDLVLGRPTDDDYGDIRKARELYDHGDFLAAARAWPAVFHTERRALKAIAQSGGKRRRGFAAIDKSVREFYISAYQSRLFNRIVAARLERGLATLHEGDLAWLHASGAVFRVEDAAIEQPRADRFDISPTGPLFGYRMTEATGLPGELEAGVLAEEQLSKDAFHADPLRIRGGRRPLRFQPVEPTISLGADASGTYLELGFFLPRGCYATALLRELFVERPNDRAAERVDGTEDSAS